jgi:uncharacterized protein
MKLAIKVVPGASREEISGWLGEVLKVRVRAAPEAGKANKAVRRLLSTKLGTRQDYVLIVSGASSAHKIVEITGLSERQIRSKLTA